MHEKGKVKCVKVDARSHTVSGHYYLLLSFLCKNIHNFFGDETSLLNSVLMMLNDFVYNIR